MRLTALCAALAAFALLAPQPAAAKEMEREDIEKIVHDYLLAHPEILNEMIEELRAREERSADEKAKAGIAENQGAIYSDGYSYAAGNPNGDVTLIEFFDYRCGYCKKVRSEIVDLLEQDKNVRVIIKELPILSAVSHEASKAAIAALNQGGDLYWKLHQAMLSADDLDSDAIYEIAGQVGLDVARLKKDMEDPSVEDKIMKNHDLAEKLGVDGTPAFIIGEQLVPGYLSADELKSIVASHRGG